MTSKIFKKIAVLIAVLLIAATAIALVACDGDKDNDKKDPIVLQPTEGKFTVGVFYEDGTPVQGANVGLCIVEEDGTIGLCHTPQAVDANGISVQEYEENTVEVHIDGLPDGYDVREDCKNQHISKGEAATVYVVQKVVDEAKLYKVKVVLPNGSPVQGVTLSLSAQGAATPVMGTTDAQGIAAIEYDAANGADCTLTIRGGLPTGYQRPANLASVVVKAGQTTTITLTAA